MNMNAKQLYRYEYHLYRALCNQEISHRTYMNNSLFVSVDWRSKQIALKARDTYHAKRIQFTGKRAK